MEDNKITWGKPADKSLEAFKKWITDMTKALGGKEEEISEAEWAEKWREFWMSDKRFRA
jgi:hypothetical protein